MMETKKWAIALVLFSTLIAASGQVLIKLGLNDLDHMMENLGDISIVIPTSGSIIIGYCMYGLAAVILIYSLKHGELSVLYPLYAMNYIWIAIMSPYFFPTDFMNPLKWAGVLAIVCGVALIGLGSGGKK